jgi:hypothetical protein
MLYSIAIAYLLEVRSNQQALEERFKRLSKEQNLNDYPALKEFIANYDVNKNIPDLIEQNQELEENFLRLGQAMRNAGVLYLENNLNTLQNDAFTQQIIEDTRVNLLLYNIPLQGPHIYLFSNMLGVRINYRAGLNQDEFIPINPSLEESNPINLVFFDGNPIGHYNFSLTPNQAIRLQPVSEVSQAVSSMEFSYQQYGQGEKLEDIKEYEALKTFHKPLNEVKNKEQVVIDSLFEGDNNLTKETLGIIIPEKEEESYKLTKIEKGQSTKIYTNEKEIREDLLKISKETGIDFNSLRIRLAIRENLNKIYKEEKEASGTHLEAFKKLAPTLKEIISIDSNSKDWLEKNWLRETIYGNIKIKNTKNGNFDHKINSLEKNYSEHPISQEQQKINQKIEQEEARELHAKRSDNKATKLAINSAKVISPIISTSQ